MDTRTLQIVHEFDNEPTYIVTRDDDHEDIATVEPTTPNAVQVADELVRRWNAYPELIVKSDFTGRLLAKCHTLQALLAKSRAYYFRTAATTPEQAAAQVCAAEGAPASAVIGVEEVPAIIIRTPSDLKFHVEANGHEPYYFDRKSMAFFGDTMRNYGTRSKPVNVTTPGGEVVACWELYRKRPVKHGLNSSSFFACDNFRRVFADKSKHPQAD